MSISDPQLRDRLPVFTASQSLEGLAHAVVLRDAQASAHAADGAARTLGAPAITAAHGLADSLKTASGLVTAHGDKQQVVAVVAVSETDRRIVEPALWASSRTVIDAAAGNVVEQCREALPLKGPVSIIARDAGEAQSIVAELQAGLGRPTIGPASDGSGSAAALTQLREAKRPLVLVGYGAAAFSDMESVTTLARTWNAPVAVTFGANGMPPHRLEEFIALAADDVPVLAAGTVPWTEAMARADVILALGSGLSEADWFGLTDARVVRTPVYRVSLQPDPDGAATQTIVEEAGHFAARLTGELDRGGVLTESGWREKFTEARNRWTEAVDEEAEKDAQRDRLTAGLAMREIVSAATADTIFVGEGGASGMWLASFGWRRPVLIPAQHAPIGASIAMSAGVRSVQPTRPVWAVVGDGAFFYGDRELAGFAERKDAFTVFVFADRSWNAIRLVQTLFFKRRTIGTDLPQVDFAGIANLHGCDSIEVRTPGALAQALAMAQEQRDRPLVVQVTVDKGSIPFVGANLILAELDGVLTKLLGAAGLSSLVAATKDFPALRANLRVITGALRK